MKEKWYKTFLWVIFLGLISSVPLIFSGIDGAGYQDLQFHLSRIEGIKEGLLAGKFPVMMESNWIHGKGYPVAIFYGDFLLYFPAILRIFGVPVILTYKIFVFAINVITGLVSYYCFEKIFENRTIAGETALLYVTAGYRLMDIYVRAAVGEYCAFIFFPILALAMVKMYREDCKKKEYLRNSLILCLGMSGLLETHLLSTVMAVFLLVIVGLFFFKKTFRPRTLLCIGLAVVETLIVNLYYLVPFLDYYMNVPVYAGKGGDHSQAMQIRESGAYVSQLWDFFGHIFGSNVPDKQYRMQLTLGIPLTLAILVCLVLFVLKIRKYRVFVVGCMSALCIWMSTNLFPWNTLEGRTHLFKLLANVQFPWRYLAPAAFFGAVLFGFVFSELHSEKEMSKMFKNVEFASLLLLSLVSVMIFTSAYKKDYQMVNFKTYSEVDSGYVGACEYLKDPTGLEAFEYVPSNDSVEKFEKVESKDNTLTVFVKNPGESTTIEVEKFNYKGYKAKDQNGNFLEVSDGYMNILLVNVPAKYEGNITVYFECPLIWKISFAVSLLSVICICVYSWKKKGVHNV